MLLDLASIVWMENRGSWCRTDCCGVVVACTSYLFPRCLQIFSCTDVTYHNNTLFVVTGYCAGDFVLTAVEEGGEWKWGTLAWGGQT